uniref:Uncharacterized protein n=1 Tax=Oryza brachyantha TaxID=4533 RepID=J3M511_ORYBR
MVVVPMATVVRAPQQHLASLTRWYFDVDGGEGLSQDAIRASITPGVTQSPDQDDVFVKEISTQLEDGCPVVRRGDGNVLCSKMTTTIYAVVHALMGAIVVEADHDTHVGFNRALAQGKM